jgi:uncharacterized protein (DUF1330 family)
MFFPLLYLLPKYRTSHCPVKKHFGRYVVLGGEAETIEGDWNPQKVVVIEFPSKENAHEFLKDPDAQPLFAIRHKSTTSKVVLVEGYMS